MITVTRFDNSALVVNADLIEFVETLPDTHITLVTGKKLLVRESAPEVVARVLAYRQAVGPAMYRPIIGEHASVNHTHEE
jgi:flagellar protein FlbD